MNQDHECFDEGIEPDFKDIELREKSLTKRSKGMLG